MPTWQNAGDYPAITRSNWLIKAADLQPGQYLTLYPRHDLDWNTAQKSLDVQYGKHRYRASTHGGSLNVFRVGGEWK